ncbi:MAG: ATP-binding protein [Thermodesulfobacteriota bacterium]|nr:ATP-binding protein [Thermodesulfobacteriota bacterium]
MSAKEKIICHFKIFNSSKKLQHRLIFQVILGLMAFSVFTGIITYNYSYRYQLDKSINIQNQLIATIQSQAEVAAFVNNKNISREIIDGLLSTPFFQGALIQSTNTGILEKKQTAPDVNFSNGNSYPLMSPVDSVEQVGSIVVVQNDQYVRNEAAGISRFFTFIMIGQIFMAAILMMWVSQRVMNKPVSILAKEVATVKPGKQSALITIKPLHNNDEIGLLSRSINSLINAAEEALAESTAARISAESANRAKSEFLDNSGEGFLSFDYSLLVGSEYSHECVHIFAEQIEQSSSMCEDDSNNSSAIKNKNNAVQGSSIVYLLFGQAESNEKDNFKDNLGLIFAESCDYTRNLYISLLPSFYQIGKKYIQAKYHWIEKSSKMMLILTDTTREKNLEQHIEMERNYLRFVIAVVRDTKDFFAIIHDMEKFKNSLLPDMIDKLKIKKHHPEKIIDTLYYHVHTFKGLFAQQEFLSFPAFLHDMETRLSTMKNDLSQITVQNQKVDQKVDQNIEFISKIELFSKNFRDENVLEQDILIIREFLGEDFMEQKENVVISKELALQIEAMAYTLITRMGDQIDHETLQMLDNARHLSYVDFKSLLHSHVEGVFRSAERMGKKIALFKTEGDLVMVHPDKFIPFAKSLVNVFRNAVAHGIEFPEERLEAEKSKTAVISCHVHCKKMDRNNNIGVHDHLQDNRHGRSMVTESATTNNESHAIAVRWTDFHRNEKKIKYLEITISDDGRGMDIEQIKKKVLQKKLISRAQMASMSASEHLELIFLSGLSTKDNVDAMSGRGMGMSAVKTELKKLNGKVEISTSPGLGTSFQFSIPL